ncbi:MAG: CRISPR-associated protein Cas4 [archaeon]|nr:CRISPR-associated protein Cas4 [archaeon]MCP8312752.1 CRISPR-associated protein Cas4 [archaeon]
MKASGYDGKIIIDVWEIVQYYYCPRKVYFLRTLSIPILKKRKMIEGQEEHLKEIKRIKERKTLFNYDKDEVKAIYHKLSLEDDDLGLAGQIDVVIELKNSKILPVEIKYSEYMDAFRGRKKQLIAYAILLERKFNRIVDEGILYFPTQNKQITLPIGYEEKKHLIKDLEKIRKLILSERLPVRSNSKRCNYCEVAKYCT